MIARRQAVLSNGTSRMVVIPHGAPVGSEATVAISRLMLVDARGRYAPEQLIEILERLEATLEKHPLVAREDP